MKLEVIEGNNRALIECKGGENLLHLLAEKGYYIPAACGGKGKCGKCTVEIIVGGKKRKVLSCECEVNEDMTVIIPSVKGGGITGFSGGESFETDGEEGYAVALDVGTTTLAAYLLNLKSGTEIAKSSALNPQGALGADVISRITACEEGKLPVLHSMIIKEANEMIARFKSENGVDRIKRLCVCGNTTMTHIFAGEDPTTLGRAPFTPVFLTERRYEGSKLGVDADEVILMPSISSYVGGDITAGIIALSLYESKGNRLLVDVGTNGEVALSKNGDIICCSTAAGPAFEGANISCGMGGVEGAISSVKFEGGKAEFKTVAGEPKGICGSGLIDLTAELVRKGMIDETGAFAEGEGGYFDMLTEEGFTLTFGVTVTGKDIREIQLAKSAICSGIKTLIATAGLKAEDIDEMFVAGGLGFYLNKDNACDIGLLPRELRSKIKAVGNSGGAGAVAYALSAEKREKARKVAKSANVTELSNNPLFMEEYIENMMF